MCNYTDWKNNDNWYKDYVSNRNLEGFIDYTINNSDYKKRVANYHFLHHEIYLLILEKFIVNAKLISKQVNEKRLKNYCNKTTFCYLRASATSHILTGASNCKNIISLSHNL
jgi:hypothetical protein